MRRSPSGGANRRFHWLSSTATLVLFHLGTAIFRVVLFPLAFLVFMVPLPAIIFYAITFPLQSLAARQAAWTLDLLGVPVILDGNVIHLSELSLGVTEACSGIRSLVSLLGGAVAWAYLALPGRWMAPSEIALYFERSKSSKYVSNP